MTKPKEIELLTINEIIQILEIISTEISPVWGKMNTSQMLKHCANFIDLYSGRTKVNFVMQILGRSFGFLFLKYVMKLDPKNTPRNLSTSSFMKVTSTELSIENEKNNLIRKLLKLEHLEDIVIHPIYGKMTKEKTLFLIKHHTMHHLNQFGLLK